MKSSKKTSPQKIIMPSMNAAASQENVSGISSQDSTADSSSVASSHGDCKENVKGQKPKQEETPALCGVVEVSALLIFDALHYSSRLFREYS